MGSDVNNNDDDDDDSWFSATTSMEFNYHYCGINGQRPTRINRVLEEEQEEDEESKHCSVGFAFYLLNSGTKYCLPAFDYY